MNWNGVDYFWIIDVFISCLVSHSDGTHSLQRIHWRARDAMLHFSKSDPMKKTHQHLMEWGWANLHFFVNCSFKGIIWCDFNFYFLWSVTSWLCIDTIPEVAKTKVSKPKRYSLSKLRFCHAPKVAQSNTPPHVYVTMWKYLHNAAQMFTQRKVKI